MLKRERAIRVLREVGCSEEVIKHSLTVERKALELAEKAITNGHKVDVNLVSLGAILHDIGRAKTHDIRHGLEGAEILRKLGLGELSNFAKNHIGAGILADEATKLGLPTRDFVPRSREEKIVAYADKLVMGHQTVSFKQALEWFKSELGPKHPALERFKKLHSEIEELVRI